MPPTTKSLEEKIKLQGKEIKILTKRLEAVEKELSISQSDDEDVEDEVEETTIETTPREPINLFKVFGSVGVFLIVLGGVYFYRYAVDHGWIGIIGRIVIGIFISLILTGIGLIMYQNEKYSKFSLFLQGGGLGILYFTIFATYHFPQYRTELGMTLVGNTILLLVVIAAGMIIGFKLNEKIIVYGSLGLGYLAAFLSGIDGNTLHILLYVLILDLVIFVIAKFKAWFVTIPALILTYIAYLIWFIQGIFSPQSILNQTSIPVVITISFLLIYYTLFTIISFIQASDFKEQENGVISLINTICLAGFGLGIISKYYSSAAGLYLVAVAAITLIVASQAKRADFKRVFEMNFLLVFILIGLAIPVQFDKTIVSIMWIIMFVGIAYAGMKIEHQKLFYVGYIGYSISFLRMLWDMIVLSGFERVLSVVAGIIGLITLQVLIAKQFTFSVAKKDTLYNVYSVIGVILTTIWFAVEVYNISNISLSMKHLILSLVWALFSIAMIMYGIGMKRKIFNWLGVILFGIVVYKILFIDLATMENILRVAALVFVGTIALIGSFIFVKNKEKIKEYM